MDLPVGEIDTYINYSLYANEAAETATGYDAQFNYMNWIKELEEQYFNLIGEFNL